ncbi:MAG: Ig domain-containing protein [Myxococcota bacterium]
MSNSSLRRVAPWSLMLIVGAGCPSTPPKFGDGGGTDQAETTDALDPTDAPAGTGADEALVVSCGAVVTTAIGATISHSITVAGASAPVVFGFADPDAVPEGLVILAESGEISGVPATEVGTWTFAVTAEDAAGRTGSAECTIEIRPALALELAPGLEGCLAPGQSLLGAVATGSGDGSQIACAAPGGEGNGALAPGFALDATECTVVGTFEGEQFGTWVTMVRATQSGASVWVPFCVTRPAPAGAYAVQVSRDDLTDATLTPLVGWFDPEGPFSAGDGSGPWFTVEDAASCGVNACSYGFRYEANGWLFLGDAGQAIVNDQLLRSREDDPIGLEHGLAALVGDGVAPAFRGRPWVTSLAIDYCLSAESSQCSGASILDNAGARFHYSVLMFPDPTAGERAP